MNGYAEAHLLLARIHLIKGEPAKAEPSLRALERAFPDAPAVQTELGLLEFRKNNPAGARVAFERALSGDPASVDALAGLIRLDIQEKRPDLARRRLETALAARPDDVRLLRLAAETVGVLADPSSAERFLRRAIDADPGDPAGYSQLGSFYARQQRLDEAIRQFEQLAERQPNSVGVQTSLGTLLQMQNRTAEARVRYAQALAVDPQAPVAANNLAWIHAEEGSNLDEALRLAQTAKARLPNRAEVNDTLGWVYVKKGLGALAVPVLRQSVQADPRNASYHYHLGMAYAQVGQVARARASLERCLELNAGSGDAAAARAALAKLKG
jgi:tetratricopeptide (TPR) repeat protein